MKNFKIISIAIICFITIFSCKNKNTVIPIKQDVVDYFGSAKTGSYYVFQDSITGIIDTFKVTNYQNIGQTCYTKGLYSGLIEYQYITTYSHQDIYVTLNADCDLYDMATAEMSFGAAMGGFTVTYNATKFDSINPLYSMHDSIIATILTTYSVNITPYNAVLYLNNLNEQGGYASSDYWIAPRVGIIQIKNYRENWNWKLINKKIIQ